MAFQPLTKDQYQKAIDAGFSPDEIIKNEKQRKAQGGEVSTGIPGTSIAGAASTALNFATNPIGAISQTAISNAGTVRDLGIGAVKGAAGTVKDLIGMGQTALDQTGGRIANALTGKGFAATPGDNIVTNPGTSAVIDKALTPTNTAQKIGGYGEKAAEILAPSGFGAKAIAEAPAVVDYLASRTGKKILEMVSPRLTSAEAEKTAVTAPTGILGKISAVASDYTKQMAAAAKGIINPAKTFTENANAAKSAIIDKAVNLEKNIAAKGQTYIYRELKSVMKNVDIPHFIKTAETTVQKKADSIIGKFMEIAQKNGGKIESLLKSRREFDSWVKKEYPRIFDESGNAVNQLVKNIRTAANDFIAEKVPDVAVKEELKAQSLLYDVEDVLREKAVHGVTKVKGEIGSTNIGRFAAQHPGIIKGAGYVAGTVASGIGLGAVMQEAKKLTGQ